MIKSTLYQKLTASLRSSLVDEKAVQVDAHWIPAYHPFQSNKAGRSDLKIAGILSERLYFGLRDEADLTLVGEKAPIEAIDWSGFDLFLVETCLCSATGEWRMAFGPNISDDATKLVENAAHNDVPTVFWFTLDYSYLPIFKSSISLFDKVFASDPKVVHELNNEGIDAVYLPPAFQPRMFNPLRSLREDRASGLNLNLIAGINSIETFDEIREVVEKSLSTTFQSFERTHVPTESNVDRVNNGYSRVNGNGKIPYILLPEVLKRASTILVHENMRISETEALWQAVENTAAMCSTIWLHGKKLPAEVEKYVIQCENITEAVKVLDVSKDSHSWLQQDILQKWRQAYENDTFEQRLSVIAGCLKLPFVTKTEAKVSIVTPTMRVNSFDDIIVNFNRQKFKNKELIIVFNGSFEQYEKICLNKTDANVTITHMPRDNHAAAAISLGHEHSSGEYVFRFDDDDLYGENYISDTMLYTKADDFDLIGKAFQYLKILGKDEIYMRKYTSPRNHYRAFKASDQGFDGEPPKRHLSGASFGLKASLLRKHPLPMRSLAAADSTYLEYLRMNVPEARILKTDPFNFVVGRNIDPNAHTWRSKISTLINFEDIVDPTFRELPR